MTARVGFKAVASMDAHVLILGSLPGTQSLLQQQYYAKKSNSFWRIMEKLTGLPAETSYEKRLAHLRRNRISLWDVCASATRPGSLDSSIELATVKTNDFMPFFKTHKHIKLICFNGQPAEKLFRRLVLPTLTPEIAALPREILPSTSPAHAAMRFEEKAMRWQNALSGVLFTKKDK